MVTKNKTQTHNKYLRYYILNNYASVKAATPGKTFPRKNKYTD